MQALALIDYLRLEKAQPSVAYLRYLQNALAETLLWENIDVFLGNPRDLSPGTILHKIITQGRGGTCYELNYIYSLMLKALGFNCYPCFATIHAFNNHRFSRPRTTHMCLLVEFAQQTYLSDLGWNGYRSPLSLAGAECEDSSGKNRLRQLADSSYALEKYFAPEWILQYTFTPAIAEQHAIEYALNHTDPDPENEVAHSLMLIKFHRSGYQRIFDRELHTCDNGAVKQDAIASLAQLRELLLTTFRLQQDYVDNLLTQAPVQGLFNW